VIAGLALDVERPVEVVAGALQLELGTAAALAMLAEPRRLLDEQAPLAGLRVDDLLDLALADHRMHLAPEIGVGEDLEHVREAAAGAVEAVLALTRAVEAALDRDLREDISSRSVRCRVWLTRACDVPVVDHDLDLCEAAPALSLAAGEDHVLHRLAPHGERALLAESPQHGVGDVRLTAPVGTHDHADAGREHELRALGEGLEALHRDRFQMHGR
jgi:hypothetical protein